ncbi:hypothetical protein Tco_0687008 [Tanacetum coccineum]
MPFVASWEASFNFFYPSFIVSGLYVKNKVPIPLGVWNFMALWILDTTIPICCMAVLPSNRLCRELDPTMTKLRIYVLMKGLSPIVISKGTSPRGQECSPEKPTSGIYESTLSDLIEGFNFLKQCS